MVVPPCQFLSPLSGKGDWCVVGLKALSNAWVRLICRCLQNSGAGGMTGVVAFIFPSRCAKEWAEVVCSLASCVTPHRSFSTCSMGVSAPWTECRTCFQSGLISWRVQVGGSSCGRTACPKTLLSAVGDLHPSCTSGCIPPPPPGWGGRGPPQKKGFCSLRELKGTHIAVTWSTKSLDFLTNAVPNRAGAES